MLKWFTPRGKGVLQINLGAGPISFNDLPSRLIIPLSLFYLAVELAPYTWTTWERKCMLSVVFLSSCSSAPFDHSGFKTSHDPESWILIGWSWMQNDDWLNRSGTTSFRNKWSSIQDISIINVSHHFFVRTGKSQPRMFLVFHIFTNLTRLLSQYYPIQA